MMGGGVETQEEEDDDDDDEEEEEKKSRALDKTFTQNFRNWVSAEKNGADFGIKDFDGECDGWRIEWEN